MIGWLSRTRRRAEPAPGAVLHPARDVLTARRDGAAVLLDLKREVYLSLDETAAIIWEEIERGADTESIHRRLAAEFDAPDDVLQRDATAFLRELCDRGLVVHT
jgi:hypothetical protein